MKEKVLVNTLVTASNGNAKGLVSMVSAATTDMDKQLEEEFLAAMESSAHTTAAMVLLQ